MKYLKVVIISLILIVMLFSLTGCSYNKTILDVNYQFTKCITWVGNEVIEIEIASWTDFTDGEQIQIIGKDGNVYLVSSMNSILINEKGE